MDPINYYIFNWKKSNAADDLLITRSTILVGWLPPPENYVKLNTDDCYTMDKIDSPTMARYYLRNCGMSMKDYYWLDTMDTIALRSNVTHFILFNFSIGGMRFLISHILLLLIPHVLLLIFS